ncbi:MAG: hypothetical protein Q7S35_05750 [Candidatus Limnocylindrales bacterium]|nr:hypothetical protein [Candidatus Limnocylindrales bacterium]
MDRRTRNLFALVLVVVIAVTGGAAVLLSGSGVGDAGGSANAPSLVGVIVGVRSEGLDKVRGFSLRTQDGATVPFSIGNLENGVAFPPGHLVEHQATAQPVRVWYRTEGETKVAIRLEDTP